MRRVTILIVLTIVASLLFVGCENQAAMERMQQLQTENVELRQELEIAQAQVVELEEKLAELTPEEVEEAAVEEKKPEEKKQEAPKQETPAQQPRQGRTIR